MNHSTAGIEFTIEELRIPQSLDGDDGTAFTEMTRVGNDIEAAIFGSHDLAYEPVELLALYHDRYAPRRLFVARIEGRIVGLATHELQSGDNPHSAWLTAEVLPKYRHRGIGSALYDTVESIALAERRTTVQAFAHHGTAGGARLDSPTGFGSVPLDDDGTRFALARGFALAQVDRISKLTLPADVPVMAAPEGYELEFWEGPTPQRHLAEMALLQARMSTDPPLGEVDYEPESWDEKRVVDMDATRAEEGRRYLTTAVRHLDSNRLAGFTELVVPPETRRPVFNHKTLVLGEHRGRRLGMLVKRENLHRLQRLAPGHPAIYTWNAEENRHMLDVNEAIGFVPVGYEGSWKKVL